MAITSVKSSRKGIRSLRFLTMPSQRSDASAGFMTPSGGLTLTRADSNRLPCGARSSSRGSEMLMKMQFSFSSSAAGIGDEHHVGLHPDGNHVFIDAQIKNEIMGRKGGQIDFVFSIRI